MACLQKRGKYYYIVFSERINGKLKQKKFSLRTKRKKRAERLKVKYEELREHGEIAPFNGWHPKQQQKDSLNNNLHILEKAAEEFIKKRSEAGETTKNNYRRHLNMLKDRLGKSIPVKSITEEDIRSFCFRPELATATKKSYLNHLKVFFRWLKKQGLVDKNVTKDIKALDPPNKIVEKTITYQELMKIFDAFDEYYRKQRAKKSVTKKHQMRVWFKPLIATTYYTGLRAKEVVNLRWRDVDLINGYITIKCTSRSSTKTGKERRIPIRENLKSWLINWYLNQDRPKTGYVFPSSKNINGNQKMCKLAMSKSYKKFVRLAGLPESINFHGLRHTCATDLLREGLKIESVADWLGDTVETVNKHYKHLDETDLKRELKANNIK